MTEEVGDRKTTTQATRAYQRLRDDIIRGEYVFGQKLNIQMLCDRYEVSLPPIREALNRASVERLVTASDFRGFYVAPINEADLDDTLKSRIALNDFALRDSIRNGDDKWEEDILLAHHKLQRIPFAPLHVDPRWEQAHRIFHAALLAGCTAPSILGFCEQLFDAADRYRHLARRSRRGIRRKASHKAIMEATLARDEENAVALLASHITETADICREMLRSSTPLTFKPK